MAGPSFGWLNAAGPQLVNGVTAPAGSQTLDFGQPPAPAQAGNVPLAVQSAPAPAPAAAPPPQAPAAPPAAASAPAAPQGPAQTQPGDLAPRPDVQFVPVRTGVTPAREVDTLGPKAKGLLDEASRTEAEAAQNSGFRNQGQALLEQDEYARQATEAIDRAQAFERVAVRRQGEMQRAEDDYRKTVSELGTAQIDQNRYWANKSTGDKIGTILLVALGGFAAGATGGPNLAYNAMMKAIDQDIEAQKFDYQAMQDKAKGEQTVFSMMMDRYHSEDAALAGARLAALDVAQAKVNQLKAQWGGAEAANKADELQAKIAADRLRLEAQALKFVPASGGGVRYVAKVGDQILPGTFDEKGAQTLAVEHGVKTTQARETKMLEGGIDIAKERAKEGKKADKDINDETAKIASGVQAAGIPQTRSLATQALAALGKSPGSRKEGTARGVLGSGTDSPLFDEDANAREQAYAAFENAAIKSMMGNATDGEVDRARKALGSAKDPESRRRAIASTLETIGAIERSIKAGASPEAQAEYDRRRAAADAPNTWKNVKSFTPDKPGGK